MRGIEYMQDDPRLVLWPGIAISLVVLSGNHLGEGLRDALEPLTDRWTGRCMRSTAAEAARHGQTR